MTLKPWAWAGLGIAGAGVVTLVGFAFVDLGAADQIASVAGGSVGVIGLVLAAIAQFGGSSAPPVPPAPAPRPRGVEASGTGAIAAGGSIGSASTGGTAPPPQGNPPATPPATPPSSGAAPGPSTSVTASGHGSIAAGGDIGSASTGT